VIVHSERRLGIVVVVVIVVVIDVMRHRPRDSVESVRWTIDHDNDNDNDNDNDEILFICEYFASSGI